jgi:NADP-dependent 3-hydroxy acid dehydrogenase YdfG
MTNRLTGTVALVTGASSGIGEATAIALAAEGASVALVARRTERLDALAAKLREQGTDTLVLTADISDQQQAADAVERVVADLGRLDTLVNNAGVMLLGPALDASIDEWQRMISVNLLGLMYCTHAALPHLLRAVDDSPRRVADVVNISSVAGRFPRRGSAAYNASKHGVTGLTEGLRLEFTGRHVRFSVVEPGAVATELIGHNRPEVAEGINARLDVVEKLTADDIADAVGYIVTRPRHVAINEILIRPTNQDT